MPLIVAMDALDDPNAIVVRPKQHVHPRARPVFPNTGPMRPRHADVKRPPPPGHPPNAPIMARLEHTGVESVHLLLLSSAPDIPAPDPTHSGYQSRKETADGRHSQQVQVFWSQEIPRNRLRRERDPAATYEGDPAAPVRIKCNIRSMYTGALGQYNGNIRYIWCPSPIQLGHIKADGGVPRAAYRAVGCTCMDMVMRGSRQATHGCKYVPLIVFDSI